MMRTTAVHRGLALLVSAALGAGCGSPGTPDPAVGEARAAPPLAGSSQIVLDLVNEGDGDDRLVEVTADAAVAVEIHETRIEDGQASMTQLGEVELPAGERVRFRPGGLHLMLVAPTEELTVGGTFELTLRFAESGEVSVPVRVVDRLELLESAPGPGDGP